MIKLRLENLHLSGGAFNTTAQHMLQTIKHQSRRICTSATAQQNRVYPYPLGVGSARPNPKMGASDPENPLFLGFSVLRGLPRPWSRKGPDHGVGVDPETVNGLCEEWVEFDFEMRLFFFPPSDWGRQTVLQPTRIECNAWGEQEALRAHGSTSTACFECQIP